MPGMPEEKMKPDLHFASCNCLALRKAARAVSAFYDRALAPTGLSSVQFGLLAAIHDQPGIGMQELSDELVMDRTNLVRAVQPLARNGYIVQSADPENSRKRALTLSAEGRKIFTQAQAHWAQAQTAFEHSVGAANSSTLRGQLSEVAHHF
ncbi:MAG: MarR family winged helix-turn-helix transcriptional regulator [Massilia sp.]